MSLQTVYHALCCHEYKLWHTVPKTDARSMVGVESQDFGHMLTRLGESPLPGQGHAQVQVGST